MSVLHLPPGRRIDPPALFQIIPTTFIDASIVARARNLSTIVPDPAKRAVIEIPLTYTGSDFNPEQKLAYFREDFGVNHHHWHWHLVYPDSGPLQVVNKNRRGELFYYMHQQLIARF